MIGKFTHANTKVEILVSLPLVFCAYYSEATKCTHLLANGGAIIPIVESPEIVMGFVEKYVRGKNDIQRTSEGPK
jgi:hypothetical protein